MEPIPSASAAISATTVAAEGTSDVATTSAPADVHRADRTKMVDLQIVARLISDEPTIAAMRAVPRHEFVPSAYVDQAYNDNPLPIGHGQTISQPYIVAAMTQLHKGKRSGDFGGLMVDLVSIVLALTAISGIVLWTTLPARAGQAFDDRHDICSRAQYAGLRCHARARQMMLNRVFHDPGLRHNLVGQR